MNLLAADDAEAAAIADDTVDGGIWCGYKVDAIGGSIRNIRWRAMLGAARENHTNTRQKLMLTKMKITSSNYQFGFLSCFSFVQINLISKWPNTVKPVRL